MLGIRRTADRPRTGRPRPLLTLVALFALLLQAFEVQTHVHAYGAQPAITAAADSAHAQPSGQHASLQHQQLLCAVCQSLAAAGAAVVPARTTLATGPAIAREAAAIFLPDAPRAPAHAWRSRAPPISL